MTNKIWPHVAALAVLTALPANTVSAAPSLATFTVVSSALKTLTPTETMTPDRDTAPGAVSADRKTMTFRRKTVRLVVHSGPDDDMLSYRIAGLRNPTLVVPGGATLRVRFINTDDDMFHNLRFSALEAPGSPSIGTATLAHKTATAFHAEDITVRVPSAKGIYYYLCTVRGHAAGGMRGTVIVR